MKIKKLVNLDKSDVEFLNKLKAVSFFHLTDAYLIRAAIKKVMYELLENKPYPYDPFPELVEKVKSTPSEEIQTLATQKEIASTKKILVEKTTKAESPSHSSNFF